MLALLVVSGVVSRWNLRRLDWTVAAPERPLRAPAVRARLHRRPPRALARALAAARLRRAARAAGDWCRYLAPRAAAGGTVELLLPRRGRHRSAPLHVASLFPLGLFRKGMRYPVGREVLVYPGALPAGRDRRRRLGLAGDRAASRAGWGHDLHALRALPRRRRPARHPLEEDARRPARWSTRSAGGGELRLSILFDNGTGRLAGRRRPRSERFEHLVSEAATAAVDHLGRGFEVELVTRDRPAAVRRRRAAAARGARGAGAGRAAAARARRRCWRATPARDSSGWGSPGPRKRSEGRRDLRAREAAPGRRAVALGAPLPLPLNEGSSGRRSSPIVDRGRALPAPRCRGRVALAARTGRSTCSASPTCRCSSFDVLVLGRGCSWCGRSSTSTLFAVAVKLCVARRASATSGRPGSASSSSSSPRWRTACTQRRAAYLLVFVALSVSLLVRFVYLHVARRRSRTRARRRRACRSPAAGGGDRRRHRCSSPCRSSRCCRACARRSWSGAARSAATRVGARRLLRRDEPRPDRPDPRQPAGRAAAALHGAHAARR